MALDLTPAFDSYGGTGSPAHRPDLLLRGVLLCLLEGRPSPAQWFRDFQENLAVQWLTLGIQPSRTALYEFRNRAGRFVEKLQQQLIERAREEGHCDGTQTVQDGTVIRACASRHRLMNSGTLDRRREALQEGIAQDAAGTPSDSRPAWMGSTPQGRLEQQRRYEKAREILEERLERNAERPSDKRLPEKKVVVSGSDPEAAMGRDKQKVFGPCYTAQVVVDFQSRLVVSYDVAAQATDAGTLPVLLDRTREVLGTYPQQHVVDAGYVSLIDLQECQRRSVELIGPFQENDWTHQKRQEKPAKQIGKDAFTWLPEEQTYACPQGHRLEYQHRGQVQRRDGQTLVQLKYRCPPEHCGSCPLQKPCCRNPQTGRTIKRFEGEELLDDHRRRMQRDEAQELRRLRGSVVELKFADTKWHRNFDRLHGRGLSRARAEVGLQILAHDLMLLEQLRSSARNSNPGTG